MFKHALGVVIELRGKDIVGEEERKSGPKEEEREIEREGRASEGVTERDREKEKDREGERERGRKRDIKRERERESLFLCLFGFLTSSSTTRLYRGRAPRQSV